MKKALSILTAILGAYVLFGDQVNLLAKQITLAWDASENGGPDNPVTGYKLHSGPESGSYDTHVDVGNALTATAEAPETTPTYFAVTAYNAAGLESLYSNEVVFPTAGEPVPPPPPDPTPTPTPTPVPVPPPPIPPLEVPMVTSIATTEVVVSWKTAMPTTAVIYYGKKIPTESTAIASFSPVWDGINYGASGWYMYKGMDPRCFIPLNFKISDGVYLNNPTIPAGTLRNNFSGRLGMRITVGSAPITLTAIGRLMLQGNTRDHKLSILKVDQFDVVGSGQGKATEIASTMVNMTGGTVGQFKYANLVPPIPLEASKDYIICSEEADQGDTWYNPDATLTVAPTVTMTKKVVDTQPVTDHALRLSSLTGKTKYFYKVEFTDEAGMVKTSPYYSFSTK